MFRHTLSFFSIAVLFVSVFGPAPHVIAATLTLSGGASATIGQTLSIPLFVSTEGSEVLNAISAEVRFPAQSLSLQSISKTGSIVSLWAEEPFYSNSNGTASLQGIIPNPGWKGQGGIVVTLVFKVKAAGAADISFASASVLANDGLGTNILSKTFSKTLSLGNSVPQATSPSVTSGAPLAPALTSSTHPDPNAWYRDANPLFSWNVPTDVTAVRLLYDRNPVSSPSVLYGSVINRKQLTGIPNGTYYFHAQFQNASGWGAVSHMRFQVDAAPPKAFDIKVVRESNESNPQPILSFSTTDATSGIDRYTISVADAAPVTVTKNEAARYSLPAGKPGQQTVVVKAYDRAGNSTTESKTLTITAIEPPTITSYRERIAQWEPFELSGTTYSDAQVSVTIVNASGDESVGSAIADASGYFKFTWIGNNAVLITSIATTSFAGMAPGVYSFTAMAKNASGTISPPTEPRTFVVVGTPLAEWGRTAFEYLLFAFAVIAAIALIVGVGYVLWYRLGRLRRQLKQLTVRSGRGVQYDFERIMDDLHSLAALLHKAKQSRQLTKEEDVILETLKHHLKKMEDDILSRLEQIDDEAGR